MTLPTWLRALPLDALCIGLLLAALYAGWTAQGWHKDADIATLKASIAQANQQVANARAEGTAKVLEAERTAQAEMIAITEKLTKEKDFAQHEKDIFIAGVRSGAIRLSIPVVVPVPAGAGCADAATTGSPIHQARAELTPEAAELLDDIASEGDDAIRQSNALIDAYNKVRDQLNVQAE